MIKLSANSRKKRELIMSRGRLNVRKEMMGSWLGRKGSSLGRNCGYIGLAVKLIGLNHSS